MKFSELIKYQFPVFSRFIIEQWKWEIQHNSLGQRQLFRMVQLFRWRLLLGQKTHMDFLIMSHHSCIWRSLSLKVLVSCTRKVEESLFISENDIFIEEKPIEEKDSSMLACVSPLKSKSSSSVYLQPFSNEEIFLIIRSLKNKEGTQKVFQHFHLGSSNWDRRYL